MGLFDRFKRTAKPAPEPVPESAAASGPTPEPTPADSAPLHRARDIVSFPFGDDTQMLHARGSEKVAIVPDSIADVLKRMDSFQTVAGHAETIGGAMRLSTNDLAELEEELGRLAGEGMTYALDEVLEQLRAGAPSARPARPITRAVVITCDRPELLARCAESVAASLARLKEPSELLVFDDSKLPETRAKNLDVLARLPRPDAVSVRYAGREEKQTYRGHLARELGFDASQAALLDFMFFGLEAYARTTGANQNAALLESFGHRAVSFDDDTWCKLAPVPESESGLAFTSEHDTTGFWFFADQARALESAEVDDTRDPFTLFGALVGREVPDRVAAITDCDLDRASAAFLRRLLSAPHRHRVALAMTGIAGDSAMGSTSYYLTRRGEVRDRLLESYASSRLTRAVHRGVARETISEASWFMTACFGIEVGPSTPPFLPVLRNSDGIFGVTSRLVDPHALIAHLPWMVMHGPEPRSADFAKVIDAYGQARTEDFIADLTRRCVLAPWIDDPRARMRALGAHFAGAGALPAAELAELVRLERRRHLVESLATLEGLLEMYRGEPEVWARDIAALIKAARAALTSPQLPRPGGELVARYGALLSTWPLIQDAAKRLADGGVRITRAI